MPKAHKMVTVQGRPMTMEQAQRLLKRAVELRKRPESKAKTTPEALQDALENPEDEEEAEPAPRKKKGK